jgi:predicted dehydrogenase
MSNFHEQILSEPNCEGYFVLLLILWLVEPLLQANTNRMNGMKVLVIGTGSIGKRHMANLHSLGHEVYAYSERLQMGLAHTLPDGVSPVSSVEGLKGKGFDAAVIANRTDQHLASAAQALQFCNALYIEKPLSASLAGVDEFKTMCQERNTVVEIGFMMRFHPNLQWIKAYLQSGQLGEVMHLRSSIGQWLPDWRPGTDHRQGFGAFYRYGGGVTMELIHEIDLVNWLMGQAVDVCAMQRPLAQLDIETEAIAEISMRLDNGLLAQVHLDYVRPGYGRSLEIVGTQGVLTWDYNSATVTLNRADGQSTCIHQTQGFERNMMFMQIMQHFLRRIGQHDLLPAASLTEGIQALRVALASHQSARERRFVRPQDVSSQFSLSGESA